MRKTWILVVVAALALPMALHAEGEGNGAIWFGLGGSLPVGLFVPDLAEINTFLTDGGFGELGGFVLIDGGHARGGVLGGLAIGGRGWGGRVASFVEDREAELVVGFGGLELGYVIGGNERSLLTIGLVLGGGGTSFSVYENGFDFDGGCWPFDTCGIVPEPLVGEIHRAFVAVEPFVSMQVQPLRWLGFELRLGYLLPIVGVQWGDETFVDGGPSLELRGPAVGLSLTWGAIGRPTFRPLFAEETVEQAVPLAGDCVEIVNQVGGVTVQIDAGGLVQTGSSSVVEIVAVKRARSPEALKDVSILVEPTHCGLQIRSDASGRSAWSVEYEITVPAGTKLDVKQGVGGVVLVDYVGPAVIELGVGGIEINGFEGTEMVIDGGVGSVTLIDIDSKTTSIELGTGEIEVLLRPGASYTVSVDVGIGDIEIGTFPGGEPVKSSGFGHEVTTTIGSGAGNFNVELGIGDVDIRLLE